MKKKVFQIIEIENEKHLGIFKDVQLIVIKSYNTYYFTESNLKILASDTKLQPDEIFIIQAHVKNIQKIIFILKILGKKYICQQIFMKLFLKSTVDQEQKVNRHAHFPVIIYFCPFGSLAPDLLI